MEIQYYNSINDTFMQRQKIKQNYKFKVKANNHNITM